MIMYGMTRSAQGELPIMHCGNVPGTLNAKNEKPTEFMTLSPMFPMGTNLYLQKYEK